MWLKFGTHICAGRLHHQNPAIRRFMYVHNLEEG